MNKIILMKARKSAKWIWVKGKNNPMYSIPAIIFIAWLIWI
tara:strand:+ start:854 stop:976 length:123 start_codon:yes stop_codon:yes gene_type:complete